MHGMARGVRRSNNRSLLPHRAFDMKPKTSRLLLAAIATAALAAAPPTQAAGNLIRNASFETVNGVVHDQGYLPAEFEQTGNISPGADTYSNDDSYGIQPGGFGNFTGTTAQDGIRFAAGADFGSFAFVEAFGQQLSAPLMAGATYDFSGWIADSFRAGTTRGGFDLLLSPSTTFGDAGAVMVGSLAPTTGVGGWEYRTLSFVAPTNAGMLGYLIFAPRSVGASEAYIGIDNVSLTTAVPEPATWGLMGLGLLALTCAARRQTAQNA